MFVIIEFARMMVGTKAIATLSAGYLTALDFARNRVQGADLTQLADKTAPRVTIIHHPDVRRLLMLQKSYAEGMRALVLYAATFQDALQVAAAQGRADDLTASLNDLLLPVVKGVGSERAYEMLTHSLQTLGGSGFLQDYPVEQYVRDAKIDSLYEGTTAIQGMDLYFRKIVRDGGEALGFLLGQVRDFAAAEAGNGRLKAERAALARAADDLEAMVTALHAFLGASAQQPAEIYRLAAGQAGGNRAGPARRGVRRRPGVLRGEDRRRPLLRRDGAAQAGHGARDHRGHHAGPDGPARGSLLTVTGGFLPAQPASTPLRNPDQRVHHVADRYGLLLAGT